jgi:hypothetical protein
MSKYPLTFSPPFTRQDIHQQLTALRWQGSTVYMSDLHAAIGEAKPGSTHRLREIAKRSSFSCAEFVHSTYQADHLGARRLCELIDRKDEEFRTALEKSGLPAETIVLFTSFVDFRLDSQAALYELEFSRLLQSIKGRDTADMGTAEELAAALNVSAETVRRRTLSRTLIAVLGPGRKRGREYPMFQAWPGIAGAPLEAVLKALGRPEDAQAYQFMTTPNEALGGATPIEVLVGEAPEDAELAPGLREFLKEDDQTRLRAVVEAAAARAAAAEVA